MTSLINTEERVDALELAIKNNFPNGKKTNVDHIYAAVEYTTGPANAMPTANDGTATTNEDTAKGIMLIASATDPQS